MPKQFYEFGFEPFREQLFESFVAPAATWFLGEKSHAYLLPQISGSNWECALALEGLLSILENPHSSIADGIDEIETKCIQTTRWLVSQVTKLDEGMSNWDGVTWDTAICNRAILKAEAHFSDVWSPADKSKISNIRETSTRWLIHSCRSWDTDIRYPAGPPDLAQILHTLSILDAEHSDMLSRLEDENDDTSENTSTRIVRLLLAMKQEAKIILPDGDIETCYWVDCFNTSEVLEGLTSFLILSENREVTNDSKIIGDVKLSIVQAVRYLECNQVDGTWGGVADTCGTLYGYLRVTTMMPELDPKDHLVFQALRWMCDEKQALSDGSFLHTSYVTVFYFMAILEAYRDWALGEKGGPEVYDIALWSTPAQATVERSKRLELQLALQDSEVAREKLSRQIERYTNLSINFAIGTFLLFILMFVMVRFGALQLDISNVVIKVLEPGSFWSTLGIGIPLIIAAVPAASKLIRRK